MAKTATKKTATKKAPAKVAPKVEKVKRVRAPKSSVKFVSLTVRAVIPTQQYGNIQPELTVSAATYEEARAFAMPIIEDLYAHYTESKPGFLGKVIETEKVIATPAPVAPAPKTEAASVSSAPAPEAAPVSSPSTPKPEAVLKAEKAIGLAATPDAAVAIQDQIEKSVKIPAEFKPDLITLVLKRRGELK